MDYVRWFASKPIPVILLFALLSFGILRRLVGVNDMIMFSICGFGVFIVWFGQNFSHVQPTESDTTPLGSNKNISEPIGSEGRVGPHPVLNEYGRGSVFPSQEFKKIHKLFPTLYDDVKKIKTVFWNAHPVGLGQRSGYQCASDTLIQIIQDIVRLRKTIARFKSQQTDTFESNDGIFTQLANPQLRLKLPKAVKRHPGRPLSFQQQFDDLVVKLNTLKSMYRGLETELIPMHKSTIRYRRYANRIIHGLENVVTRLTDDASGVDPTIHPEWGELARMATVDPYNTTV